MEWVSEEGSLDGEVARGGQTWVHSGAELMGLPPSPRIVSGVREVGPGMRSLGVRLHLS